MTLLIQLGRKLGTLDFPMCFVAFRSIEIFEKIAKVLKSFFYIKMRCIEIKYVMFYFTISNK